jgi:uncharacterized protein YdeI (YjbR/CyaY-like superfamily)
VSTRPEPPPWRRFASVADWTDWLERNHERAVEAWIAFPKKGTDAASVTRREAWEVALCFGWIDGQAASSSMPDGWWAIRFSPRTSRSRWSKINCAKVERLTAQGRMREPGLREVARAQADGRWQAAYDPPSTAAIPPDFEDALAQRPGAAEAFRALSSRRRYAILNSIAQARRPETRARRIRKALAGLRSAAD